MALNDAPACCIAGFLVPMLSLHPVQPQMPLQAQPSCDMVCLVCSVTVNTYMHAALQTMQRLVSRSSPTFTTQVALTLTLL